MNREEQILNVLISINNKLEILLNKQNSFKNSVNECQTKLKDMFEDSGELISFCNISASGEVGQIQSEK